MLPYKGGVAELVTGGDNIVSKCVDYILCLNIIRLCEFHIDLYVIPKLGSGMWESMLTRIVGPMV